MITKTGACTNAYRDAIHQIVAKLKKERARNGKSESELSNPQLKKQAAESLHKLLREVKASQSYTVGNELLRRVGIDKHTAEQVVQQAFADKQ